MNENKLTLRNHAELISTDLDDVALRLENIIDDIDANPDETIDDEIYTRLQDLLDKVKEANDMAWELENMLETNFMGKRRF